MNTCKIIDTCTLINLFETIPVDISARFDVYDVLTTDVVISEYTRKFPRKVPACVSVVGMSAKERIRISDFEFLFPNLGAGEISVFIKASTMASEGRRTVILSDDKAAARKFHAISLDKSMCNILPGINGILWGNALDVLKKLLSDGKISDEEYMFADSQLGH